MALGGQIKFSEAEASMDGDAQSILYAFDFQCP